LTNISIFDETFLVHTASPKRTTLLPARHGHKSILYRSNPVTVLHIGGAFDTLLETNIEKWVWTDENTKPERVNSTLTLDSYTDFPAIYSIDSEFCK